VWAAAALLCATGFVVLTVLVETSWPPLEDLDRDAASTLSATANRNRWLVDVLLTVSLVLHPTTFRLVALVVVVALLLRARRHGTPQPGPQPGTQPGSGRLGRAGTIRLALLVFVTVGAGGLLAAAVKAATDRARPRLPHPVATAPGLSFPSGHAFGVMVAAVVCAVVIRALTGRRPPPLLWPVAVAAVAACGFARVGLGVHYLSDVLGGYLLGMAWATATTAVWLAASARELRGVRMSGAPTASVSGVSGVSVRINGSGPTEPPARYGGGCRS
jgi:undecaprenyl-diphosphatase